MISSWASTVLLPAPAKPSGGIIVSMISAPRVAEGRATRRPAVTRFAPTRIFQHASRGTFGCEARVGDGAVAGQRGRLDDLVVPLHRQGLAGLVHQDFEE